MSYLKYDGSIAVESVAPASNNFGSSAVETLTAANVPSSLWGSTGDHLIGGPSDDFFYIQGVNISVTAPAGGVDTIIAWNNLDLSLTPNVRNLSVGGQKDFAAGNALDNLIVATGKEQNLYGGRGQDVLVGGPGADAFIVAKGEGNDVIYGFKPATDVIRLTAGYTSFAQLQPHMTQQGADVKIDLGGADGLIVRNMTVGQLSAANFQLPLDASALGAQTFADEFNGPVSIWNATYNPAGKWRPDYGYQGVQGVGSYTLTSNGEKEIYTSPYFRGAAGTFASPFVSNGDGTLSIIARPSTSDQIFGYGYTSGMLSSRPSFSQTYGYFEMRAELPTTAGAWPAFWLLPSDWSWPPELDVMESLSNTPGAVYTTSHSAIGGHTMSQAVSFVPQTASGFHTYGLLWTASTLAWYIDGAQVFQTATPADMNKPMFMIANLALGGWGGSIDDAHLPAEMRIDYIRAYALGAGAAAVGASSSASLDATPRTLTGHAGGDNLTGGSGDDTLTGSSGHNVLRGGLGNDVMAGGSDFNDINGNQGDDTIVGHSQVGDWLSGGQGADKIQAQSGAHNQIFGNIGNDTLSAGSGGDTLRGGQGDDVIAGGAGRDWISGDRGHDTVSGGGGADVFHSASGMGVTTVTDFHVAEGDKVQLDAGSHASISQPGANVLIDLGGGTEVVLQNVQLSQLGQGWLVYA